MGEAKAMGIIVTVGDKLTDDIICTIPDYYDVVNESPIENEMFVIWIVMPDVSVFP